MTDEADSTLGEKLLYAVGNLWNEVNGQGKVLDHHGGEIAGLQVQMKKLKSQVHGLKSSQGKARASNSRLGAALDEAETKLQQIDSRLN